MDVLSLNETRLDASISNSEVEMLGYTLYKLYLNWDLNCYLLGDNLSVNSSKLYEFNSIKSSRNLLGLLIIMNHIDIRATNRPEKLLNSGVLHFGISDHSLLYGCFKISIPNKQKPKFVPSRSFEHYNNVQV